MSHSEGTGEEISGRGVLAGRHRPTGPGSNRDPVDLKGQKRSYQSPVAGEAQRECHEAGAVGSKGHSLCQ